MPKPQFSIRLLLFVTFLVAVTAWLARHLIALTGRDDLFNSLIITVLAAVLGPAGFAVLGFIAGRDANRPWRGTLLCMTLVLAAWLLFLFWPA